MKLKRIIGLGLSLIMMVESCGIIFAEELMTYKDANIPDNEVVSVNDSKAFFNFSEFEAESFIEKGEEDKFKMGSEETTEIVANVIYTENNIEASTENKPTEVNDIKNDNIIKESFLVPDEAMLSNPVMTPENQKNLLDYEAKLIAEMENEGWNINNYADSEIVALAASNMLFNQYLAQYNYTYNSYSFMKNDLKLPYRSYVETRKDDPVFQGLLWSWRAATFQLSDIAKHSTKEAGFYETILFDILYQGEDVDSISGTLNKSVKSTQASTLKSLVKFTAGEEKNWKRNLSELTEEEYAALLEDFEAYDELSDVFGAIGNVSKALSYANTVEELVYKLSKAHVIMQRTDETAKILLDMRSNTNNLSMRMALDNMILICSEETSEAGVLSMLAAETVASEMYSYVIDSIWGSVIEHCNLYGLAVSTAQAMGKTLSGLIFSTDKDVEKYYELCALYEFEDVLKKNYDNL